MFFGASFDCATVPSAKCAASVAASAAHIKESDEYWSSGAEVGADRSAADEAAAGRALAEDFGVPPEEHALKLLGMGVRVDWLVSFTFAHGCWDWPTWRVVRDVIKPATIERRCRYAQLADVQPYTGPARVFMSHCWGAPWGDLVLSAAHGAQTDRLVWIDIFAVRQWPGNAADLDFRGVVSKCNAVVVSVSTLPGLTSFGIGDGHAEWLASAEGAAAKKAVAFFRLWCVVELATAVQFGIDVIVKVGVARLQGGARIYDVSGGEFVLSNLLPMVNVESAECTVGADYAREMKIVRDTVGVSKVNDLAKGVIRGGLAATAMRMAEVDAAVCGDSEALTSIPANRIVEAIKAAAAGGRMQVLKALASRAPLDMLQRRDLEGFAMFLRSKQPDAAQILQAMLTNQ